MRSRKVLLISAFSATAIFLLLYFSYFSRQIREPDERPSVQKRDSYYAKGIQYYKEKNYEPALGQFCKALESNPQSERVYRRIVDVCEEKNNLDYAIEYFGNLSAEEPKNAFPYYGLGLTHKEFGNFGEAIQNFEKAVVLEPGLIPAYSAMAESYKQLDDLPGGLQFMKALRDSLPQSPFGWLGLAWVYRSQWDVDKAVECLDTALMMDPGLLNAYIAKIKICFATGKLAEGLDLSLTGLRLAKEQHDEEYEVWFLGDVGTAHVYMGEFHKGLNYFEPALKLSREMGDKRDQAKWLGNIGVAHRYLGNFPQALDHLQQALKIDQELGDEGGEEYDLGNIGDVYLETGEYRKALGYHTKALKIARRLGNRRSEAIGLGNIGAIYAYLGDYRNSLRYRKLSLDIDRELGLKWEESYDLGNVGLTHFELGNYTQAFEHFSQALNIAREIGDKSSTGQWMLAMASCYYTLGIQPRALEYNKNATEIFRAIGDKMQEARCIGTDGLIYTELKDYSRALECLNKALEICVESGAKREEAIALANIAAIQVETGDYDKALECQKKALEINRQMENKFSEGETLNGLGAVYLKLKKHDHSIESHKNALKIGEELSVPKTIWEAHAGLGAVYEELGNYPEAIVHYKASVQAIEDVRGGLLSEEHKSSFLENKIEIYKKLQGLLYKLHQGDPTGRSAEESFDYAERAKARALVDLLAESKIDINKGVDTLLLSREKDVLREIAAIRTELRGENLTKDEVGELKRQLRDQESCLEQLRLELRKKSPAYANLRYPEPITLRQAQKTILGKKDLLLEYSLGEENSYLWVIAKANYEVYQLPPGNEITEKVEEYLILLSQPPGAGTLDLALGKDLFEILLSPILQHLRNGLNVIVVPDGILHYLPFETLIYDLGDGIPHYVVELSQISYSPSVSLLGILSTKKEKKASPERSELLAFGNPYYGDAPDSPVNLELTERGLYEEYDFEFVRLPYSEQEVKSIASFFPEELTSVFVRDQAREEVVKSEDLTEYHRIHFAAHGVLDETFPSRSCIVLALDADPSEDGYLQLNEIFNLKMDANLVVLSACQTGKGKLVEGEGLVGLSRGFFYAGARSMLLSLWSVNDRSTAQLMQEFYRYLHEGDKKSEALRRAKIDFIKGELPSLRHPYYWAPFVLLGMD